MRTRWCPSKPPPVATTGAHLGNAAETMISRNDPGSGPVDADVVDVVGHANERAAKRKIVEEGTVQVRVDQVRNAMRFRTG